MAKPRAGASRSGNMTMDVFGALTQMIQGMVQPGRTDGLKKFATVNRANPTMPNPMNLSGVPLMNYWSSLDANTPDKITSIGRLDDIYSQYSGSPYAKWLESLGVAPHQGSVGKRADRFNEARGYPTGKIF